MTGYYFLRECRTSYSEAYSISDEEDRPVGRVDLHFTPGAVYATLCVNEDVGEEGVKEVIEAVDDELVMSADVLRADFVVTVYRGREVGVFSDQDTEEEADNGRQEQ